jgi:hypothetical protein
VTTIGPTQPRQPEDGIEGNSRAGSEATSRRGVGDSAAFAGDSDDPLDSSSRSGVVVAVTRQ